MGCAAACIGYELDANLYFAADRVAVTSTDAYPNWTPIGPSSGTGYAAEFNGNGRTISRLTITGGGRAGLFDTLAAGGVIRDLGMIAPSITAGPPAGQHMGVITASNGGTITASYVQGGTVTATVANTYAGGLSGGNTGTIQSSYSTAAVSGLPSVQIGGLSGVSGGAIIASYAAGPISGASQGGGLVGLLWAGAATITDSNCDTSVHSSPRTCVGGYNAGASTSITGNPHTTAELQAPTGYTNMYRNWNRDVDGDTFPDNPWNFGTTTTYPALKTPAQRQADSVEDYDQNDNNLIDINTLEQLNAIRHDLNGDGLPAAAANYPAYAGAFPNGAFVTTTPAAPRMGCPQTCTGYELAQPLDFDRDGDGQVGGTTTSTDPYTNFRPIGGDYTATFDGNGHTITRLTISASIDDNHAGLFGILRASDAVIRDVGLIDPTVSAGAQNGGVGALLGELNTGKVIASYSTGSGSITATGEDGIAGGLVGKNRGAIEASYSTISVRGTMDYTKVGGLVGSNVSGAITNSYSAGSVSVSGGLTDARVGGFVGIAINAASTFANNYCDTQTSGQSACIGHEQNNPGVTVTGVDTATLQTPDTYTRIYRLWNTSVDSDNFPDNPWNFGATTTYPTLKTPAQRQAVEDYDDNDNNLIDIDNLHQLNAIRHDLNGDGLPGAVGNYPAYAGAFPGGDLATTTPNNPRMGCPQTCTGYELTANLDFAADGIAVTSTDAYPNWTPIGPSPGYAAEFNGNGRTISRLTITGGRRAGLFDTLAAGGVIRDLGMIAPSVSAGPPAGQHMGVITASNGGTITASYVRGGSVTATNANTYAGGLSGGNTGTIQSSYSTAAVSGLPSVQIGGLSGVSGGAIIASYAAGPISGASQGGGLVGLLWAGAATITDSNCDTSVHSSPRNCVGGYNAGANTGITGNPHTTAQLQTPTGYTNMYRNWNLDLDGDTFPDYLWDFGTTTTYPTLYTPSERQTAAARVVDYDQDDDNLIDITNLHQLNALRYDPDGNGLPDDAANYSAYTGGYPNGNIADSSTPYMGCAATCIGYELTGNLDSAAAVYPGWTPIASYQATLDGKGFYIAGLAVSGDHANAGLFAVLTGDAVIRDLGLKTPSVSSSGATANAGALVGDNAGRITASYVEGGSVTVTGATPNAGGLAGRNTGDLRAVWSTAAVNASTTGAGFGGGLIGRHSGSLSVSYAAGRVTGSATSTAGGLIGDASAAVTASYCDTQATTQDNCIGRADPATITAAGHPTAALKTPTGYTGIYESWNIDLDGDGNNDYPWNFGEATQYPALNTPTERQARIEAGEDTLPPPLPRTIPPEPEREYDPAADHPEIYANTEYEMTATCQTHNPDPETGNPQAATVTFDLGTYTGPVLLHLSIWRNGRYMAYETQGLASPALEREGQRATVRIETDPAQTRFRLDGRRHGLASNLLLGYANCDTDDP